MAQHGSTLFTALAKSDDQINRIVQSDVVDASPAAALRLRRQLVAHHQGPDENLKILGYLIRMTGRKKLSDHKQKWLTYGYLMPLSRKLGRAIERREGLAVSPKRGPGSLSGRDNQDLVLR
jgi:hypothetical protein